MTGSSYMTKSSGAGSGLTVYFTSEMISEEFAKSLIVLERGLSKSAQTASGAVVTIGDYKKQTKRFFLNGKIVAQSGSTAWQQKNDLTTMIEAGGGMIFHNGSDGSFSVNVTKYKFQELGGEPNKYEMSLEMVCGSVR